MTGALAAIATILALAWGIVFLFEWSGHWRSGR